MGTPRKHAALIKAWADGAKIEYRYTQMQPWHVIGTPTWLGSCEYRVKPEPVKTAGYRRYIWRADDSTLRVYVLHENFGYPPSVIEGSKYFVRWIDTEWQYHEVEQ